MENAALLRLRALNALRLVQLAKHNDLAARTPTHASELRAIAQACAAGAVEICLRSIVVVALALSFTLTGCFAHTPEVVDAACACGDVLPDLDTGADFCPSVPTQTCDAGVYTLTCEKDGRVLRLQIVSDDAGACDALEPL